VKITALKLTKIIGFAGSRRGANALEYGLIIGLLAVAVYTGMSGLGSNFSRIACGVSKVLGGIAANSTLADQGSKNPCSLLADGAPIGSADTCSGQPVGATCQRLNANGGLDTVVVAQTNSLYVWPSDESSQQTWDNGAGASVHAFSGYSSPAAALTDMNGMAETTTLVGLSNAASPYYAATACRAHGPDWYLPGFGELNIVTTATGSSGTVRSLTMVHNSGTGPPYGYYWSASEQTSTSAWATFYRSDGWQATAQTKSQAFIMRCVRQ
jgi:Flp pilus assembly pilin Flp